MKLRIGASVVHKDYPGTRGKVVAKHGGIILVLWDEMKEPGNSNNAMDLPSRCSRHIPSALEVV